MPIDEKELLSIIEKGDDEKAFEASDSLGAIGGDETLNHLVSLLKNNNPDVQFLASRTLGLMKNNGAALEPLIEAVNKKDNSAIAGDLLMSLDGFDVSDHYVEIFKLYLFGSFKVSKLAKELLDYKEFNITPRVLKKAKKHWNHYQNNIKQDDAYLLKKEEVEEILDDLQDFLDSTD
ncbi:HEAT repeat domain-containing protein [Fulvivirga lutea]|uniref:HEAT repeat domain-containing protein n=1 Tax=Fulvivirga lutea TaxID=2810512 RepID=A0A974WG75_9BACT|nr:HEAT repeat domain-containing protein [Fulvivirga lutea]QSE96467.1 HEAT repeat domain-containing protein [Fulvivirga lutea]